MHTGFAVRNWYDKQILMWQQHLCKGEYIFFSVALYKLIFASGKFDKLIGDCFIELPQWYPCQGSKSCTGVVLL